MELNVPLLQKTSQLLVPNKISVVCSFKKKALENRSSQPKLPRDQSDEADRVAKPDGTFVSESERGRDEKPFKDRWQDLSRNSHEARSNNRGELKNFDSWGTPVKHDEQTQPLTQDESGMEPKSRPARVVVTTEKKEKSDREIHLRDETLFATNRGREANKISDSEVNHGVRIQKVVRSNLQTSLGRSSKKQEKMQSASFIEPQSICVEDTRIESDTADDISAVNKKPLTNSMDLLLSLRKSPLELSSMLHIGQNEDWDRKQTRTPEEVSPEWNHSRLSAKVESNSKEERYYSSADKTANIWHHRPDSAHLRREDLVCDVTYETEENRRIWRGVLEPLEDLRPEGHSEQHSQRRARHLESSPGIAYDIEDQSNHKIKVRDAIQDRSLSRTPQQGRLSAAEGRGRSIEDRRRSDYDQETRTSHAGRASSFKEARSRAPSLEGPTEEEASLKLQRQLGSKSVDLLRAAIAQERSFEVGQKKPAVRSKNARLEESGKLKKLVIAPIGHKVSHKSVSTSNARCFNKKAIGEYYSKSHLVRYLDLSSHLSPMALSRTSNKSYKQLAECKPEQTRQPTTLKNAYLEPKDLRITFDLPEPEEEEPHGFQQQSEEKQDQSSSNLHNSTIKTQRRLLIPRRQLAQPAQNPSSPRSRVLQIVQSCNPDTFFRKKPLH